jgi:hypothetical protein
LREADREASMPTLFGMERAAILAAESAP